MTAPMREPYRAHDCTITYQDGKWEITLFVHFGKFAVLLLALLHLLFEVRTSALFIYLETWI